MGSSVAVPSVLWRAGGLICPKDPDMDVSKNSGFYPQIINLNRVFRYFHHPFWGFYHCFWKHPYIPLRIHGEMVYSPTWMVDFYGFHVGTVNIPYMDIMDPMGMSLERDYIPPYSYDLGMGCFRPSILF